jgi:hypothetical protein
MKAVILFCAAAGALAGSASVRALAPRSAAHPHSSLCRAGETVLFQCRIGAGLAAVCGDRAAHDARYRFGTPGRIELESPAHALVYARAGYSRGGEIQFHFAKAGYEYVVYSRIVRTNFGRGGNNPKEENGLFVRHGGRIVSQRRCTGLADGDDDPNGFAREGEFIYQL